MAELTEDQRADYLARLNAAGAVPLTAEEILAGLSQAGVRRPSCLHDHEDDGTVGRVTR